MSNPIASVGDICLCAKNKAGLVTKILPQADAFIYKGIQLFPCHFGEKWESVRPKVIKNIYDVLDEVGIRKS